MAQRAKKNFAGFFDCRSRRAKALPSSSPVSAWSQPVGAQIATARSCRVVLGAERSMGAWRADLVGATRRRRGSSVHVRSQLLHGSQPQTRCTHLRLSWRVWSNGWRKGAAGCPDGRRRIRFGNDGGLRIFSPMTATTNAFDPRGDGRVSTRSRCGDGAGASGRHEARHDAAQMGQPGMHARRPERLFAAGEDRGGAGRAAADAAAAEPKKADQQAGRSLFDDGQRMPAMGGRRCAGGAGRCRRAARRRAAEGARRPAPGRRWPPRLCLHRVRHARRGVAGA